MRILEPVICRTCGCSHTRLGISEENAVSLFHQGERCHFCCQECLDDFETDPHQYLQETNDFVLGPACLAEKPVGPKSHLFCLPQPCVVFLATTRQDS